jgi:hypothetical protein
MSSKPPTVARYSFYLNVIVINEGSGTPTKLSRKFLGSREGKNEAIIKRAQKAIVECIPLVIEEIGVEMSISKRFQQGTVVVLEVDTKGCNQVDLLVKVLGEESAKYYANVRLGLNFLDMSTSREGFDSEVLAKVQGGLMETLSAVVPEKIKLQDESAEFQVQCVALDEKEEAKWLFNFLEFMEQMK